MVRTVPHTVATVRFAYRGRSAGQGRRVNDGLGSGDGIGVLFAGCYPRAEATRMTYGYLIMLGAVVLLGAIVGFWAVERERKQKPQG